MIQQDLIHEDFGSQFAIMIVHQLAHTVFTQPAVGERGLIVLAIGLEIMSQIMVGMSQNIILRQDYTAAEAIGAGGSNFYVADLAVFAGHSIVEGRCGIGLSDYTNAVGNVFLGQDLIADESVGNAHSAVSSGQQQVDEQTEAAIIDTDLGQVTGPGNSQVGRFALGMDALNDGGSIGIPVEVLAQDGLAVFGSFAGAGKIGAAKSRRNPVPSRPG